MHQMELQAHIVNDHMFSNCFFIVLFSIQIIIFVRGRVGKYLLFNGFHHKIVAQGLVNKSLSPAGVIQHGA